jgi:hypothetical protein
MPTGLGWHGAKSAFAHPYESVLGILSPQPNFTIIDHGILLQYRTAPAPGIEAS